MSNRLIKIVCFDEGSAIDYIDIFNGGLIEKTEEQIKQTSKEGEISTNVNIKTGILFQALKPLLSMNIEAKAGGTISHVGDKIIKNTISNTVLTDFLSIANNDTNITKFKNCKISAFRESFSFYKMYTPYLNMIKKDDEEIDYTKIDKTLEASKGYYELIITNQDNESILRFNLKSFRNNYNLTDLTRMDLNVYCVYVGKMNKEDLNMKSEFEQLGKQKILTIEEIEKEAGISDEKGSGKINVYDVILAGTMLNE